VRFFVHRVAQRQLSLRVISFSRVGVIPPMHHNHLRLRDALNGRVTLLSLRTSRQSSAVPDISNTEEESVSISSVFFHVRVYCLAHDI
jgi:hypothetical protein